MPTPSEQFFSDYADAYERFDANAVAELYFKPAVIMSDDKKNVYTSTSAVAEVIAELMDKLESVGVVAFEPLVCQAMRLSDSIMFANVKWTFRNADDDILFTCFVSYTLQSQGDSLKIVVSVIDDEERELDKLLFPAA